LVSTPSGYLLKIAADWGNSQGLNPVSHIPSSFISLNKGVAMREKAASAAEVVGAAFLALAIPVFVGIGMVAVSIVGKY
jgi:hypothetical protein